jgi:very-short-patch-repair endonuclease
MQRPETIKKAKALRARMSLPEVKMWLAVKDRQLGGFRIRRQAPIGPFIADFACFECKLVVEVDGSTHDEKKLAYDRNRQAWLEKSGLQVFRIPAIEVLSNLDGVLEGLLIELRRRAPTGAARHLPHKGGG